MGSIRALLTGTTGMIGEGVLHECLQHPSVEKLLLINRKPCGVQHPKIVEIIHRDFHDLSEIENKLEGYNACFFCLGTSSVGMKEIDYHRSTYDLTIHVAETLLKKNREVVFCYVSGTGTDSTEKGKSMWARVKGKTENKLRQMGFKQAYMFRPGFIVPTKEFKNTLKLYRYLWWLIPVVQLMAPKQICTLTEIGQAMINAVTKGYEKTILEIEDIKILARNR